jgi:hypothetical protein
MLYCISNDCQEQVYIVFWHGLLTERRRTVYLIFTLCDFYCLSCLLHIYSQGLKKACGHFINLVTPGDSVARATCALDGYQTSALNVARSLRWQLEPRCRNAYGQPNFTLICQYKLWLTSGRAAPWSNAEDVKGYQFSDCLLIQVSTMHTL